MLETLPDFWVIGCKSRVSLLPDLWVIGSKNRESLLLLISCKSALVSCQASLASAI